MSHSELADKIGVQRMQVWRWEVDEAFPSPEIIDDLANVFGLDVSEMFGEA